MCIICVYQDAPFRFKNSQMQIPFATIPNFPYQMAIDCGKVLHCKRKWYVPYKIIVKIKMKWNNWYKTQSIMLGHYRHVLAPFSFLWPLCFSLVFHVLINSLSSPHWATWGTLIGFHLKVICCLILFPCMHYCDHVTELDPPLKYWRLIVCACLSSAAPPTSFSQCRQNAFLLMMLDLGLKFLSGCWIIL